MSWKNTQKSQSFLYYDDGTTGYPIAAYQCVSLGDATDVAAAIAAGIAGAELGNLVIPTPASSSFATRRLVGVTGAAARNGANVEVIIQGIAEVMVNAAVVCDARLTVASKTTRTSLQTPWTNLPMGILADQSPEVAQPYYMSLVDDTAVVVATTGSNTLYYYLGYAMQTASAQYDVIPVELARQPFYA